MNRRILIGAAAVLALSTGFARAQAPAAPAAAGNPFEAPSPLPYQAPPFDRIKDSDFQPGLEEAMQRQAAEIAAIADNPAAPTFDNTVVALEKSGAMLDRVTQVFYALTQANTNDTLQKVEADEAPKMAAHQDSILLNPKLFARVKSVYDRRDSLHLAGEQLQLVKVTYDAFIHAGARLDPTAQARMRDINKELSSLSTDYEKKLLDAAKSGGLVVDDVAKLQGLSSEEIAAAAQDADQRGMKGKWILPLQNTTQQPALESLAVRDTRKALFDSSWTRAEKGDANDTRGAILKIDALRAEKAALLGYPNYAAYTLEDQMANTPDKVLNFMAQLAPPVRAKSAADAADIQAMIDKGGEKFDVKPWDWERYAEQVRKARFDLDQNEVRPYFELHNVLENGLFYAANQLYGITFKPRKDIPVYQPDVMVYEVFDKDGSQLGLIYFDYFKRDNKQGGAWMSNFVGQSKLRGTKPVVYNVANFTKPAPGQPMLMTFDDVSGMFHEFGHALHGLFAAQTYPTLSGTNVARDFVEFPSQFNEHWALDPKIMAHYAVNYKTGAHMPQVLIDKIKKAATFNQAYSLGETLAAAELDMQWHTVAKGAAPTDVDAFETEALKRAGVDFPYIPPRYRSSYFLHIWANGYAAGYYAYIWTEMLDDDAYSWFMKHGGPTRANGQRFRDMILSKGHTEDYGTMFRAFYGRDPDIEPLLEHRGLSATPEP